jgi:hypothetical protein
LENNFLAICTLERFFYLEIEGNESPLGRAMREVMDFTLRLFD